MMKSVSFAFAGAALAAFAAAAATEATLGGCTYSISATEEYPPFPPQWVVAVEGCGARVVLGASYREPALGLIAAGRHLVASFTHTDTPSGEAHWKLSLAGLSAGLSIDQVAMIAAMSPGPTQPQLGNVVSGELWALGGLLFVRGEYDGIIPGILAVPGAPGGRYLAVFAGFFAVPSPAAPFATFSW